MSLLYFTGNPDPAGPFSIDYNASADGLFPADLVYKSQSNLFFKMKGLNPKNLNPAPLLLSMAGLKEIVLDDFEIQRVTEGGRTVWSQIKASKQEISVIGSAEFSSQEGGKGSFFIQGPAAYSKRMDLGITEAGKWYPREN
ncbi:MAG: hypothetical protein K8S54_13120, partial [Spirochaetia bacterium]|nr:hypothetical protein [Spirochaetia bacterium]